MANQSNPIQFQSINLLNQTASFIITRDLQNSKNIDDYDRSNVNSIIIGLWSKLKHSPQDFSLKYIMSNIEKSFAIEQQKMRGITFSSEGLKNLITNNVNILFKELAKKFQTKQIFGNHIPVDISSYERLQRIWEDEALQTIWGVHLARQFVFNEPAPTSPVEIKAWLKDPANAMQLNGVQKLEFSGLKLRAIPPEISALTRLQKLYLNDNQISSIPDSLSNLSQLKKLDLGDNQISSIPDSLSNLSRLQELDLDDNQINSIPDSLSKLSQLKKLNLEDNQINSIPDSLSNLSQLQELNLESNEISNVPDSLGSLSQLRLLNLAFNKISSIPDSLGNLSQLQTLLLGYNQISCVPDSLSKLSQLAGLSFDNNQISSIPDSLGSLPQLQELDLTRNQISSIPDSLGSLSQLTWINLGNNQISSIPDSLGSLSQLKCLDFQNNRISSIPDSISKLSRLQELNLDNNQISSIPDSLGSLSQLKCLDFQNNQISSIPDSLGSLSQLKCLDFQNNQISSMPDALSKLSQVEYLNFDANPLLFIYDKSPTSCHILKLVARYSEFKEYKCLSSFSNLCQLMVQKNDNHQMIKEAFENLKKNDQNLIFEMVYKISGIHSNEDPIFWGEHHVFNNMNIFYHAVKKAIVMKFDRLSLKEKNTVYEEIYQLARPETEDPKWGEHHAFDDDLCLTVAMVRIGAFDHVLRLIDAMDKSEFVSDVQEFDKSLQALLSELFH
jgi:Leucine-rich repeat (LRR) protein